MLQLIRGRHNLHKQIKNSAVTIGNFDGLHLGHQALLQRLTQKAREMNLSTVVITFEPQPNEYFAAHKVPPRLMRLREKLMLLKELTIDYVLCLRFDKKLANVSAEDFVKDILVNQLGIRYIIVGEDFRFGCKRSGDIALLQKLGSQYHFEVEVINTQIAKNERISSTAIRQALEKGDLSAAEKLLGRRFGMWGYVVHGDKRGRIIGFPTANIYLHRKAVPISGVFAVKMYGVTAQALLGVANVGNRPTVDGTRSLLEVHLFDFDQSIYGEHVYVEFIRKLREERRFESLEKLKEQIFLDAKEAREVFGLKS